MARSFRMWRWLSALALIAAGLVVGACQSWGRGTHAVASRVALQQLAVHTDPVHLLSGPQSHVAGHGSRRTRLNWSGQRSLRRIWLHRYYGQLGGAGGCAYDVRRELRHLDRDRRRGGRLVQLHYSDGYRPVHPGDGVTSSPRPGTSCPPRARAITVFNVSPGETRCTPRSPRTRRQNDWKPSSSRTSAREPDRGVIAVLRSRDIGRMDRGAAHGRRSCATHPGQLRSRHLHRHDVQRGQPRRCHSLADRHD